MRIAHCVRSLDPADGGLPAIAQRLAAVQAAAGHETLLITHDLPEPAAAFLSQADVPGISGVEHRTVATTSPLGLLREATRDVPDALNDVELFHLHGLWDPMLAAIAAIAVRRGVPYIVAPQGMLDPWSLRQKAWKKRVALRFGYRSMLERAAFVQVLHEAEAEFATAVAPKCRTEVLPNGIFLDEIPVSGTSRSDYFQSRFGWPGDRTVLFLGRLHHKKGPDILTEAFGQLAAKRADARLVVAGPDEGARASVERRISEMGLSERVAVPGPIYGPEKYAAIQSAACFALPSRQEGFSIAVLEALACGTPVVITEACHFPEVAGAGAGYVVSMRPDEHAAAYDRLLSDSDARSRMGDAGRRLVRSGFTWEAVSESSVRLYERYRQAALCTSLDRRRRAIVPFRSLW